MRKTNTVMFTVMFTQTAGPRISGTAILVFYWIKLFNLDLNVIIEK